MNIANRHRASTAAYDIDGRAVPIGGVASIHMRIRDGEVLEGEAGPIGRIKAADRAIASALIAERILNQDRSGGIRWIVVIRDVSVALVPRGMMAQNLHANRLRSGIHQP